MSTIDRILSALKEVAFQVLVIPFLWIQKKVWPR